MPFLVVPMLKVNDKRAITVVYCGVPATKVRTLCLPSLTFSPPGLVFQSPVSHPRPGGNQTLEAQQTGEPRVFLWQDISFNAPPSLRNKF